MSKTGLRNNIERLRNNIGKSEHPNDGANVDANVTVFWSVGTPPIKRENFQSFCEGAKLRDLRPSNGSKKSLEFSLSSY